MDSFSQGINASLVLLDGGQLDVSLVPHSLGHMGEDLVTPHSPDGSGFNLYGSLIMVLGILFPILGRFLLLICILCKYWDIS